MKLILVLAATAALCAGHAIPTIPGDNSHYVEGESRYIWMSDMNGEPILVDLHEPVDTEAMNFTRNGADNAYWLFTRQNPSTRQVIVHGNANTIWSSNYNANRPTKVLVHGWNSNGNTAWCGLVTSAYLDTFDVNVIVVDWNRLAGNLNYAASAAGVPGIGQFVGNFLVWLLNTAGGNWNNVHLIGHSLGAHVVGNAGRTTGNRPGRITGMDPAGPLFGGNSNALRNSDGVYVESIHTDGGSLGIMDPISNADFYPNGGRNPQPGCWISTCSHGRAPDLFAASVRFNRFVGRLCANLAQAQSVQCSGNNLNMGNGIMGKRGSGLYGLSTGASWPF